MKIACQSCQAKYTIADEKVLGRVVKIRCKKCGATIVINGNETSEGAVQMPEEQTIATPSSRGAFDYAAPQAEEPWTVNVADGDQRTMTTADLVSQFKAGVVNDETYCWRDGMGDWLPLREIEPLASACGLGAEAPAPPAYAAPAAAAGAGLGALFGGGDAGAYAAPPAAEVNGNGAAYAASPAPAPAAARRAGGRAGGADLFGAAAEAGGENDVMTSAPQGAPAMHETDNSKLTGQRNENSVLFSLNALTQGAPKEDIPGPQGDGSGLIDIRALSANMAPKEKKQNHVDDIMNLGGGGAFSAALAAPVLAPPPVEAGNDVYGAPAAQGGKSNKTMLIVVALVGAVVVVLLLLVLLRKPDAPVATTTPAGGTAAATTPTPTAPTAAAGSTPAAAANSAMAAAAPTASGPAPVDPTKANPAVAANTTHHTGGGSYHSNSASAEPSPAPASAPAAPAGGGSSLDQMMKKAAGASGGAPAPAPASGGSEPFDRGAAAGALGGVNVASCKRPDGPTGPGHVSVTFAPDGSVSVANVDQPPYAGTAVGGCVAGKFRGAHVPAFSGGSIKVGKSFVIN